MKLAVIFQNKVIIAGLLLALGLIIKGFAIVFQHPLTFLIDLAVSSLFICAGIIIYLISVFSK